MNLDELANGLPHNNPARAYLMFNEALNPYRQVIAKAKAKKGPALSIKEYYEIIDVWGVFQAYCAANNLTQTKIEFTSDHLANAETILTYLQSRSASAKKQATVEDTNIQMESTKQRHLAKFGHQHAYAFSEDDQFKVREILGGLRAIVMENPGIETGNRKRLLDRIETIQSEITKTVPDYDKFWGLAAEICIGYQPIGQKAKPLIDDLVSIIGRIQQTAFGIPVEKQLAMEHGLLLTMTGGSNGSEPPKIHGTHGTHGSHENRHEEANQPEPQHQAG